MPAPKKNPLTNLIKKGAKKAVVKVKPKPNLKAEPRSNVKVKPAAKTKGNPYDEGKMDAYASDSMYRVYKKSNGDSKSYYAKVPGTTLPAGKAKHGRVFTATVKKKNKKNK